MIPPAALFVSLRESIKESLRKEASLPPEEGEEVGIPETRLESGMPEEQRESFRLIYALSLLFAERDEEIEKMLSGCC